jgi:phage tail P2-like protein
VTDRRRRNDEQEVRQTLLPPNATPFERAVEQSTARLDQVPTPINDFYSPERVQSKLLPWLAWQTAVNDYNDNWSDAVKRNVIASSYILHAHKGTKWAIDQALGLIGITSTITQWYDYGGRPYHFRMEVDADKQPVDFTEQMFYDIFRTVYDKKNARSWLDTLKFYRRKDISLYAGIGTIYKIRADVPLATYTNRRFRTRVNIGTGFAKSETRVFNYVI